MRASNELYKDVAERCSAYDKSYCCSDDCFSNSVDDSKSCLNCKHFSSDEHCRLDLYDSIVENMN